MENSLQKNAGLGVSQKFGYLCGGLSYVMCMMIPTFLIYYSTESLALSIGSVSLMMTLVKVLDGVTDIIAGILIDRTNSKKGKARPWFLRAAIPYAICIVLLFAVPQSLSTTGKLVMLAVFYALTVSVFGTLIGVARYAIVPRMTSDPKERGQLGVLGDGIGAFSMGLGMAVTLGLVNKMGWTATFSIYAVIVLIAALLCYGFTRERTEEISGKIDEDKKNSITISGFIAALFKNKYALILFLIVFFQQLGAGATASAGTYYFKYVAGNVGYFSTVMTITTVLSLIGMFVGMYITKKIGPKNLFILGGIGTTVCYLVAALFGKMSVTVLLVAIPLSMLFGQTFLTACFAAFSASAVDYGEKKNGVRAEGVTSSVLNIGIKIGTALSTATIGAIMSFGGFQAGGVTQTASALSSISVSYLIFPMLAYLAATLLVVFAYRIDRDMDKLDGVEK